MENRQLDEFGACCNWTESNHFNKYLLRLKSMFSAMINIYSPICFNNPNHSRKYRFLFAYHSTFGCCAISTWLHFMDALYQHRIHRYEHACSHRYAEKQCTMRCKTIITTINTAIIIAVAAAAVKAFQQADDLSYFLHSNNDLLSALSYHSIYTHTFLSPFGFCLADAVATAFQFQFQFFRFFLRKRQHETCASSNSMSVLSISN